MATGISSHAAFIPRMRIAKGAIADAHAWALPALKNMARGERAVCSWDEDTITMAVQAARQSLPPHGVPLAGLTLASTTAPFADLQNATIVARALCLSTDVSCQDIAGTTRAGLRSLALALQGDAHPQLVLASDKRSAQPGSPQELRYGAGAAAILTGTTDLQARFLGAESLSLPFVDHFREAGERYDYYGEERWIRDEGVLRLVPSAIETLLKRAALSSHQVTWFGLAGVPQGAEKLVAKALGIPLQCLLPDLIDQVGDAGTAHALLLLESALDQGKAGDIVVIASFNLGCDALAFEILKDGNAAGSTIASVIADKRNESSYTKMLSFGGELRLDWGPRSETQIKAALTQQYRAADQVFGFVGGKCTLCGQAQFPRLPTCITCAATDSQVSFPLADEEASVATISADWLQFYPAPPLYVGLVQFDAGARLLMEIVEVPSAGLEVGARLRFEFRLKAHDDLRGYGRYFWKAIPVVTR